MSFVAPYGDLTSRGKFNQAVTFKRKGDAVLMTATPSPKLSRTPGQVAQRNRFISASNDYKLLFFETKRFYNSRARMISRSGRPFYIAVHMKDNLPSLLSGIPIKTVDSMFIHNTAGTLPNNFKVTLRAAAISPQEAGCFLWTKLDDLSSTINPEIGPVGSPYGTLSFIPGKFGNALDNTGQPRFITYPIGEQNLTEFVCSLWWQPHFDYAPNFVNKEIVYLFGNVNYTINLRLTGWNWSGAPKKFFFELYDEEGIIGVRYYFDTPGWSAEEWHHLLFAFNNVWGDGGRARFYFDEIPMNIHYIESDDPMEPVDTYSCRLPGGSKTYAAEDNVKVYNSTKYLSGIINNINNEGFDVPPFVISSYGDVEDNSNIFTPGLAGAGTPPQTVFIEETAGVGAEIPFYYPVWVNWTDLNDVASDDIMRLPEIKLDANESLTLHLAKDFSLYYDPTFRRLACTGKELL